ncbi:MAG: cytochrome ubiquinol oxidase subunit I, partial [Xanthobacteraceae bacterium]
LWWRGTLFGKRWYLWIVSQAWWTGFVGVIAGWVVTESGRQPWIAHGILRTADATSPVLASNILATLVLFVLAYGVVFSMGIYYINRLINRGPEDSLVADGDGVAGQPLGAAGKAAREAINKGG